jgi:hypothetical protein
VRFGEFLSHPFGFLPDPARARRADDGMHAGLADSLRHLSEATAEVEPMLGADLGKIADRITAGMRVKPLGFALYYRLALALMNNDLPVAKSLGEQLKSLQPRSSVRPIQVTGERDSDPLTEMLAAEGDTLLNFAPVPDADAKAFGVLLDQGLTLMQRHLPELRAEIDAIVHEFLLGHAQPGSVMEFDGASHYQFWGLLMLNPKHHKTPLAVVEVLAHECAHSLLFGLTIDEPLVLNPDAETYKSPLRADPRPMDGIYHATFVSARMAYAMERMAAVSELSAAERQAAQTAARSDRENFAAGLTVVREHGLLTKTGAGLMAAAEAWISA